MLTNQNDPATTAMLLSAFKLLHLEDAAAQRGADNTQRYLSSAPILDFDPTETRTLSEAKRDAGTFYVTDGAVCTCPREAGWCKHRISHRLKLAQLALTDPAGLIRAIAEQAAPAESEDAAITPTPAAARIIAEITAGPLPFEIDDAEYARIVIESEEARARFARRERAEREIAELYA